MMILMSKVKPKGAAFVSRALESVLRKFPVEASRMLADGGVLKQVCTYRVLNRFMVSFVIQVRIITYTGTFAVC